MIIDTGKIHSMRFNSLLLLSIVFLFSALCYSGELFDIKAKKFVQETAEILLHLSKFNDTDWSLEYEKMNSRAGKLRHEIAVESGANDAELFGRIRWHNNARHWRSATPLGTDKVVYDAWRKTINSYYRRFFVDILETGGNKKTTQLGSWTFNFQLLTPAVADYNNLLISLVRVDSEMNFEDADSAVKAACMAFPSMTQFPLATNVHIAVLRVFSNDIFLATYLLAVDTGNSNSYRDRASVALKTAFLEEGNGPYTGLSVVHSTKKSSNFLREQAASIFHDFFEKGLKHNMPSDELLSFLGKLRWHKSHSMEFARGSAAIAEWFESSMAISSGYNLIQNQHADRQAFSLPLEWFLLEYKKNTKLIPIAESESEF